MSVSKERFEIIVFLSLNCLDLLCYLLVIIASGISMASKTMTDIVLGIYAVIMCVALIANEVRTTEVAEQYFRFLCVYRGRGLVFIFFACLVLRDSVIDIIVAIFVLTVGLTYLILSYTGLAPLPDLIKNYHALTELSDEFSNYSLPILSPKGHDLPPGNCKSSAPTRPVDRSSLTDPTVSPTVNGTDLDFGQSNRTARIRYAENNADAIIIVTGDETYDDSRFRQQVVRPENAEGAASSCPSVHWMSNTHGNKETWKEYTVSTSPYPSGCRMSNVRVDEEMVTRPRSVAGARPRIGGVRVNGEAVAEQMYVDRVAYSSEYGHHKSHYQLPMNYWEEYSQEINGI